MKFDCFLKYYIKSLRINQDSLGIFMDFKQHFSQFQFSKHFKACLLNYGTMKRTRGIILKHMEIHEMHAESEPT